MKECIVRKFDSSVEMRDYINGNHVDQDSIVQILVEDRQYVLIYFA